MGDLTNDFSRWEFECKCRCKICNISTSFINRLQLARTLAKIKFTITSGCRCPMHNKMEGGSYNSDHIATETIQCEGADIKCNNSNDRFKIIKAGLEAGFNRIGIAKTFIHLGMSEINPQEVIWLY